MKFSVSHLYFYCFPIYLFIYSFIHLFIYSFIYLFIYLFRAANFMHSINIIHRSFFPTALPHRLPFLFLALSVSLPCLILCPAYFLVLPMPTSFCLCLLPMPISSVCFLALPTSVPCLFPCPAFFLALPTSVPCLFP